jgi:hypothetical protein
MTEFVVALDGSLQADQLRETLIRGGIRESAIEEVTQR